MRWGLKLGNPKTFYSETHRPSHFLKFSTMEDVNEMQAEGVDSEDLYE